MHTRKENHSRTAYQKAGVDPVLAARLIRNFVRKFPPSDVLPKNYFCQAMRMPPTAMEGQVPNATRMSRQRIRPAETYLTLSTDGVGTKLLLGIETGILDGIGQDLVGMIYNDLITSGSQPFAFLDYYATGKIHPKTYRTVLASIDRACRACDMPLVGGETAEMPGLYEGRHFDLAGFGVGWLTRAEALSPSRVRPGHVLVGFPSSGFHSNGFSLIRKTISRRRVNLNQSLTLNGRKRAIKDWLMEPTRLYTDVLRAVRAKKIRVFTLSHITGGGFDENLPRSMPAGCGVVLRESAFQTPSAELFRWFARTAGIPWREMMRIFNCGFGMVATCAESEARRIRRAFPEAQVIGFVKRGAAFTVIP